MKTEKAYVISFGDSDKYSVPFDGSREDFEKSADYKHIKDAVYDYVRSKFPSADLKEVANPEIEEISSRDQVYPVLNEENLGKLKHDVARQIEVKMSDTSLNSDAPYSKI